MCQSRVIDTIESSRPTTDNFDNFLGAIETNTSAADRTSSSVAISLNGINVPFKIDTVTVVPESVFKKLTGVVLQPCQPISEWTMS